MRNLEPKDAKIARRSSDHDIIPDLVPFRTMTNSLHILKGKILLLGHTIVYETRGMVNLKGNRLTIWTGMADKVTFTINITRRTDGHTPALQIQMGETNVKIEPRDQDESLLEKFQVTKQSDNEMIIIIPD